MARHKGPFAFSHAAPACLAILLVTLACQPAPTNTADVNAANRAMPTTSVPSHDLSRDESEGGHTLRKHVGQTDEQLAERLRAEHNISAASTWTDRATAEHSVAQALQQNRDKITRWLDRSGGHPNLVVDYDGDRAHPIGRSLRRNADRAEPCAHATVVLKWAGSYNYYILTSYPECRE